MKRFLILFMVLHPMAIYAQDCDPRSAWQQGDTVSVQSATTFANAETKVTLTNSTNLQFNASLRKDPCNRDDFRSFKIPGNLPDGAYFIQIKATPDDKTIGDLSPSQIVVQRPTITAVAPPAAFKDANGVIEMAVLGSGFRLPGDSSKNSSCNLESDPTCNLNLRFANLETPNKCQKHGDLQEKNCYEIRRTTGCRDSDTKVDRTARNEGQIKLCFHALDKNKGYYTGQEEFTIQVDAINSQVDGTEPKQVERTATNTSTLTLIDSTSDLPMTVAVVGLILILVAVYALIMSGKTVLTQTFGKKSYVLSALFLDVQTYSYSLSKCQFYVWTAAAVFGYIFLAISKSYVQGSAVFPDIPSGLPGILLASAGTAVLATGITSAKGDKGAGDPQPKLSDFITTGGVVAADRLQFAIWTLVGVGTFLAIIFRSDPRKINDLPNIPTGFLQLMGISAGGYLAGKLARKPGPTLDHITVSGQVNGTSSQDHWESSPQQLTFELTGKGLSRSGLFTIDNAQVFPDTIFGKDAGSKIPEVVQQDPAIGDPEYARILRFTCTQPRRQWLGGPHTLTITNPDAQKASCSFQIFEVTGIRIAGQKLTITGQCLDDKLKVEFDPPTNVSGVSSTPTQYTAVVTELKPNDQVAVTVSDTADVKANFKDVIVQPAN